MATYGAVSSTAVELSMKVELAFSCSGLPRLDTLSKSDPMVIVYAKDHINDGPFEEIGRTEQLQNNHNPKFTKMISINYRFEEVQPLRLVVVDVDDPHRKITEFSGGKDLIGVVECTMGDIMGSRGSTLEKKIENKEHTGRDNGRLRVSGFEVSGGSTQLKLKLSASNLDKKDFLGKSDPYVTIHRGDGSGNFQVVHKTEYIKQNLNPVWNEFSVSCGLLCGNDPNLPLKFEVWDWDKDGGDDFIGMFVSNLSEMKNKKEFELINPKLKEKKKSYRNSGNLQIREIVEYKMPTFLDFVTGGTEISLVLGIDYTGSNGDPSQTSSLHYRDPTGLRPNEYMSATRVVGDVVAPYDNDQFFPAFGFGAYVNPLSTTTHCFAINGNESNPNCVGIDGVLEAYVNSFNWLTLSGPTNFAPIINNVCNMAAQYQNGEKYHVLLMMTDGIITDMNNTLQVLKRAADLPISIIIVGVGMADFDNMNVLDDDDGRLGLKRDVVQFVPYRDYKTKPIAILARDTLVEIPKALVTYMVQHGIQPRPRFVPPQEVHSGPPSGQL